MNPIGEYIKANKSYVRFDLKLEDGTLIYKFAYEKCSNCNDDWEEIFYTDCKGNQITPTVEELANSVCVAECQFPVCGTPTGDCRCYGSDVGPNDYVYVNSDNETEGSFSNNLNTLKWDVGGGDGSLDGSIPYIDDCINGGGVAAITILDSAGSTVIFEADSIISSTSPTASYGGTGLGSFSGKILEVTISCSTNPPSEGKACAFKQDDGSIKWFDTKTGVELTLEDCETLQECATDLELQENCETDLIEFVSCSTEATPEVAIDDKILTVAVQDCEGTILSSKQYNVSQGNVLLTQPVNSTDCNPEPDVTETEECILDIAGQRWTEITIVQDATVEVIYVNQITLDLGIPAGDPSEWATCAETARYLKEVCYIDSSTPIGIVGRRWDDSGDATPFDTNTNIFPEWNVHINGDPDEEVLITNNWAINDSDFPATSGGSDRSSQELYYAWLNVTETIRLRDFNPNNGEYISIFLEDCNKDMVQVVKDKFTGGTNDRNAGEFADLCPGIRRIAIQISDFSFFGGFQLQFSNDDGATWANFPISQTYSQPPKLSKKCILLHDDGNVTNIDGTPFSENTIECDLPCFPMTREDLPDTEVSIVDGCDDIDGNSDNFINVTREVIFEGGRATVTYYTNYGDENLQAVYTIQGSFVDCATGRPLEEPVAPPTCENWGITTAYMPVGQSGVNVERWVTNATTGLPGTTVPSQVFNGGVDYSGMPAHQNGAPDGPIVVETDLLVLDQVDQQDQFRYWTYLYITEPIRLRERQGRAESVDYYLGRCCNDPILVATGVFPNNTTTSFDVTLEPGIHYIGGEVFDFSFFSGVDYQFSVDNGVTWGRVPTSWLYSTKPTIGQCPVRVCIETGVCTDLKTQLPLGPEVTLCRPSLCSGDASPVAIQHAPQTFYRLNFGEVGTIAQQWTTNAVDTPAGNGVSYRSTFGLLDAEGYPAHSSGLPADTTTSIAISSTANISNTTDDQAQADFWIYLDQETDLREFNSASESAGVWLGDSCCSVSMSEVVDGVSPNNGATLIGSRKGIYRVRLYHNDLSGFGTSRLQGSTDGGTTWVNLTAYQTKPTVDVINGWVCSDGNNFNQDRTEILGSEWLLEDPRCSNSGGPIETRKLRRPISLETGTFTTTQVVVAGASEITVQVLSGTVTVNEMTVNSCSPLVLQNQSFGNCEYLYPEVTIVPSANSEYNLIVQR